MLVAGYFYWIAANQYVAHFRFAVTESSPILPGSPPTLANTSTTGSIAAALTGSTPNFGSMGAALQNQMVVDYLASPQVIQELSNYIDVRGIYDSERAGNDLWARFPRHLPPERFLRYWNRMVEASYDPMTGLATVSVRAFSPKDALDIANGMVRLAENLVNRIAKRPQTDAVRFAENELSRAELRVKQARQALTEYRLQEGVIDPTGSRTNNIALLLTLRTQVIQQQADLAALLRSQTNVNALPVQALRTRLAASKDQLEKLEKEVSKDREGNRTLTELVDRYERIDLERQYAQSLLIAAEQALEQAKANAAAQHLYLTPYVMPTLPVSAQYPKRAESVLIALAIFSISWIVGLMMVRTIREHVYE
jgi:capsular polysaccharide transport system permease protein